MVPLEIIPHRPAPAAPGLEPNESTAKVVGLIDGDTFTVSNDIYGDED